VPTCPLKWHSMDAVYVPHTEEQFTSYERERESDCERLCKGLF